MSHDIYTEDRIFFQSKLERRDVCKYLSASDIFLFPTLRQEGLPLNILEALACGLPVITSDFLQFGQKLSEKLILVNPNNIDAIIRQIEKTKLNEKRASAIPKEFTIETCVEEYKKIIEHA